MNRSHGERSQHCQLNHCLLHLQNLKLKPDILTTSYISLKVLVHPKMKISRYFYSPSRLPRWVRRVNKVNMDICLAH